MEMKELINYQTIKTYPPDKIALCALDYWQDTDYLAFYGLQGDDIVALNELIQNCKQFIPDNSAALQAEIDALNSQITALNADKTALQAQITSLNSQISSLNAQIATLDDNMTFYYNSIGTNGFSVSFWIKSDLAINTELCRLKNDRTTVNLYSATGLSLNGAITASHESNTWVFYQITRFLNLWRIYKNGVQITTASDGTGARPMQQMWVKRPTGCLIANVMLGLGAGFLSPPTRET